MIEKKIVVNLEQGVHIRPAKQFVKIASAFNSEISIHKNGQRVNGKSILGIMALAINLGEEVTLVVDGVDEHEAISSLEKIFTEREG
jgi:catabolite repression HPr-like protein